MTSIHANFFCDFVQVIDTSIGNQRVTSYYKKNKQWQRHRRLFNTNVSSGLIKYEHTFSTLPCLKWNMAVFFLRSPRYRRVFVSQILNKFTEFYKIFFF